MKRDKIHSLKALEAEVSEMRKAILVESAKLVIKKVGLQEATLRKIANEAQATTGAIYHYFKNQHHIWAAVYVDAINELIETLDSFQEEAKQGAPEQNTRQFVTEALRYLVENSWMVDIVMRTRFDEDFDAQAKKLMEEAIDRLMENFTSFIMEQSKIPEELARKYGELKWAFLNGLIVMFRIAKYGSEEDQKEKILQLADHALDWYFSLPWNNEKNFKK